jgi:hypothetical protein
MSSVSELVSCAMSGKASPARHTVKRRRTPGRAAVERGAVLPAVGHRDLAALHLEDPAGHVGRLVAAQPDDQRRDVLRSHGVEAALDARHHVGEHRLGHPGPGGRRDGVRGDAVASQFGRLDHGQRGDRGLCGAVVGLPDAAHEAGARTGVDDPRVHRGAGLGLVAPVRGRMPGGAEVPAQVDADRRVPLVRRHVHEHPVAHRAGVVDQRVEPSERVDRRLDEALCRVPVGDVVVARDGLAAGPDDAVDDLLCGRGVLAAAVERAADVVDDDTGALAGELQGVLGADAAAGAGDDDDATRTDARHAAPSQMRTCSSLPAG